MRAEILLVGDELVPGGLGPTLASAVGRELLAAGCLLAVAESCTGGLVAASLTDVPGASAWFAGGAIAYSNALKERILSVPAETLERHGAVSHETARAMAIGARERLGTAWAVSTTGIAGPSGAVPGKPVGTVFVGIAGPGGHDGAAPFVTSRHFLLTGPRAEVRQRTVSVALTLLWWSLRRLPPVPMLWEVAD